MANLFAPAPKNDALAKVASNKNAAVDDVLPRGLDNTKQLLTTISNSVGNIEKIRAAKVASDFLKTAAASGAADADLNQTKDAIAKGINRTDSLIRNSVSNDRKEDVSSIVSTQFQA